MKNRLFTWILIIISFFCLLTIGVVITYGVLLAKGAAKEHIVVEKSAVKGINFPDFSTLDEESKTNFMKLKELKTREAYLVAQNRLVAGDSVYGCLSLRDSVFMLEIKGVSVYSAKLKKVEMSEIFNHTSDSILTEWVSTPFVIKNRISTIVKEPIVVKDAPKDTLDYEKNYKAPELPAPIPVYYYFQLNKGVDLQVFQSEDAPIEKKAFMKEREDIEFNSNKEAIKNKQLPSFKPWIRIEMSQEDATVIFRALPLKGNIVITL